MHVIWTCETHFVNVAVGPQITFQSDMVINDFTQQTCCSNYHSSLCSLSSQPFPNTGSSAQAFTRHSAAINNRLTNFVYFWPALPLTAETKCTFLRIFFIASVLWHLLINTALHHTAWVHSLFSIQFSGACSTLQHLFCNTKPHDVLNLACMQLLQDLDLLLWCRSTRMFTSSKLWYIFYQERVTYVLTEIAHCTFAVLILLKHLFLPNSFLPFLPYCSYSDRKVIDSFLLSLKP